MIVRRVALATALLLAAAGCSRDGGEVSEPAKASVAATSKATTTTRDYTATTGASCTVGTIPPGTPVPPGCDRLYSPYLAPGGSCIEGQDPNCIDPDGNGPFVYILGGGKCLVERKDPERCRDDNGDGVLDEPLPG